MRLRGENFPAGGWSITNGGFMIDRALNFARENVVLTSVQNALGGFGVAVLVQWYVQGTAFAPMWLAWLFVGFSVAIHVYEAALALMPSSTPRARASQTTTNRSFSTP